MPLRCRFVFSCRLMNSIKFSSLACCVVSVMRAKIKARAPTGCASNSLSLCSGRSNRIFGSLAAPEMPIRVVMNADGR
jgi:hypothetical protein